MSLSPRERLTTRTELARELTASGWSAERIAAVADVDAERVRAGLDVTGEPADVWLVRDVLDAAVREAGGTPGPFTHLTEGSRRAAEAWFGIRSRDAVRDDVRAELSGPTAPHRG